MNNEPVSISTLITPVSAPTAMKAPLQAARPAATEDAGDLETSESEARTINPPKPHNHFRSKFFSSIKTLLLARRARRSRMSPSFRAQYRQPANLVEAEIIRTQIGHECIRQDDPM